MELRHLRYFVAVAELLNFRRAAERLRVAQPALSRQIRDLEDQVGTRLLDRNRVGVALTDAGAVFLDEAREIIARVGVAASAAREAAAGRGGRLTIGSFGALSANLLAPALSRFHALYPQVEVHLDDMRMPDQLTALRSGRIQVAFMLDRGEWLGAGDIDSVQVMEGRIAVALGRAHPCAARRSVALADLAGERFLCVGGTDSDEPHVRFTLEILTSRGIRPRPIRRVGSFESLVALVAGNHGVAMLLPIHLLRTSDPLVFRRIKEDGDDLVLRLMAVWRKGTGSQLVANFVGMLGARG